MNQKEHRKGIEHLQEKIAKVQAQLAALRERRSDAESRKLLLLGKAEDDGILGTDGLNKELFHLREQISDTKAVEKGLRGKLDAAIEEWRGHCLSEIERAKAKHAAELTQHLAELKSVEQQYLALSLELDGVDPFSGLWVDRASLRGGQLEKIRYCYFQSKTQELESDAKRLKAMDPDTLLAELKK